MSLHFFSSTAFVFAVAIFFGACDTTEDTSLTVISVDFRLDVSDPDAIGTDGFVASFATDDIISPTDRDAVQSALRDGSGGGLVVAYIATDAVFDVAAPEQTFSALPLTRGYEGNVQVDTDGDGTPDDFPFVDYTITYEYSFDQDDFYFDVTSSASVLPTVLPELLPPAVDFRLVVIPDELFFVDGQAGARVDLRDYAAVKATYGLPD